MIMSSRRLNAIFIWLLIWAPVLVLIISGMNNYKTKIYFTWGALVPVYLIFRFVAVKDTE